jgi:hypothetical protein
VLPGIKLSDIFETYNDFYISPGFESGSYSPLTVNAGSPVVTNEESYTPNYSLKVFGSSSQQLKVTYNRSGTFFMGCAVKVSRYAAGVAGAIAGSNYTATVNRVTDGWEIVGGIVSVSSKLLFVGSASSANLDAYIDSPVAVNMSIFGDDAPTEAEMLALYKEYLSNKINGVNLSFKAEQSTDVTAQECKDAFVAAMNAKAALIGASTANFADASGLVYANSQASAKDILQILVHAAGIPGLAEKWNKKAYTMAISGSNARQEAIVTSVQNTDYYDDTTNPILGGKTGTLTVSGQVTYNLAFCTTVRGVEVAIVTIGAASDAARWQDAQSIVNYIDATLSGQEATLTLNSPFAAACKLPANPIMYDNFPFELLVSKSPAAIGKRPASLTKIMSLITAYDYINDESELVTIDASDIIGGSGANISAGDVVSIRDLIYDMLLPSSNNAATALARVVGQKILKATPN